MDLEAVTGTRGGGRHPLPAAWQVQDEMQKAGVDDGTKVVVYDDAGGSVAARLWFLLGWFGHGAQAVLDGGMQAWGEPLETRIPSVVRGAFRSRPPDRTRILDFEAVQAARGRPADRRAGRRALPRRQRARRPESGPRPGGAQRAMDGESRGRRTVQIGGGASRSILSLGVEEGAVVYCGSGVNACHDLLAMELAGVPNGRLYAGSWSDWSHHDAPVATGKEPG